MRKLRLKNDEVLVRPTVTRNAIVEVTEKSVPYENHGEVVLLGAGNFECAVGDEVIFPMYAGREKIINDSVHLFLSKDSILAILER